MAKPQTKMKINCAVITHLINTFVLAKEIVQSLFFLNLKSHSSIHFLCLCWNLSETSKTGFLMSLLMTRLIVSLKVLYTLDLPEFSRTYINVCMIYSPSPYISMFSTCSGFRQLAPVHSSHIWEHVSPRSRGFAVIFAFTSYNFQVLFRSRGSICMYC